MATQAWPPLIGSRVPPEIWSTIFDFACLDDGFTARSLSSVSRHIRALSEGHRHRTIKISSTSQIIALERQLSESGVIAARTLKTRFVSIALPISATEEAYPEDVPGVNAPSSYSGDSDYQDSEWTDIYCSSDDSVLMNASEVDELTTELNDIERDEHQNEWTPHIVKSLEDLDCYGPPLVRRLRYQVDGAVRRLLEASSNTLEVLSFYYHPVFVFPLDVLIPPLPRLRCLSVGLTPGVFGNNLNMDGAHPQIYPSLQALRLLGNSTPCNWWKRIIESVPDSSQVTIVSGMNLYRALVYCKKKEGCHVWKFVENDFYEELPELLEKWWLEDVNGGNGIPTEEELDEGLGT